MVPIFLLLILLVIAWPIIAIFGGTLVVVLGAHLNIVIPTVLIATAYIAFLAPIAKRNNIKLGGKIGEPLDPSKPIGPEFQATSEHNQAPTVRVGIFDAPDRLRPVPREHIDVTPSAGSTATKAEGSNKRAILISVLALCLCAVLLIMAGGSGLQWRGSDTVAGLASTVERSSFGNWQVDRGKVSLASSSGTNYLGEPVLLSVTCLDGRLDLKFHFGAYLGADDGFSDIGVKTVHFQVGSETPEQVRMSVGPDQTTLLAGLPAGALISKFSSEKPFLIYTQPFNAEPISATFDTKGGEEALASLTDECEPATIYSSPILANVTFNGDGGMITVLSTGDSFPFTRNFPPGVEHLYGDCRMAIGQNCEIDLDLNGNKLARIWWARVPVKGP